jgi:hypothetical protein
MAERRSQFRQRLQHEPPLGNTRMRYLQTGCVNHRTSKEKHIDIDIARAFGDDAFSTHLAFDLLYSMKQLHRHELGLGFNNTIQKVALRRKD